MAYAPTLIELTTRKADAQAVTLSSAFVYIFTVRYLKIVLV